MPGLRLIWRRDGNDGRGGQGQLCWVLLFVKHHIGLVA